MTNRNDNFCLVFDQTGASRGIGKGIALELGKAGATVYVTGTSSSAQKYTTDEKAGGTVEETADLISTTTSGKGIAYVCDHSDDAQVKDLFDTIRSQSGRLDILINNAFRIPKSGPDGLFKNFWEEGGIEAWDAMHSVGLRSHYVASSYAVPLMRDSPPSPSGNTPMIGMISSFGGLTYTFNVAYGVGKAGVDRMAKDMAQELRGEGITVCSFWPGVVMTERMKNVVDSGDWDKNVGIPLDNAESPAYTGRAIVKVACDDNKLTKSGNYHVVAELAREYGFFDENGTQPPSIRSLKFLVPAYMLDEKTRNLVPDSIIPDLKLPFWLMAGGRPDEDAKI